MSYIKSLQTVLTTLPHQRYSTATAGSVSVLNVTGETAQVLGYVHLENPLGGSKTISSSGGKIIWMTGSVTFSNGSSTFTVGIQDVSTSSSPGQGDGVNDVSVAFTGGGGGITANAVQQSAISSGSKTIAHGDLVALVFAFTARQGIDSITISHTPVGTEGNPSVLGGAVIDNTSGAYTAVSAYPKAYIQFDDGTVGWFFGFAMQKTITTITYNSTTGTADEYGNLINIPYTFHAIGIEAMLSFADNSSDCELLLYTDPLGTPAVAHTITVDATQISTTAAARFVSKPFSSPYLITANTPIGISCRPTTANNLSIYAFDGDGIKSDVIHPPNSYIYGISRLDNTGAFSDYNGGTAKTRLVSIWLYGYYAEQGVNMCSGQVGVF